MPDNDKSNDDFALFRDLVQRQERQNQETLDQCISFLKEHNIPTHQNIRNAINSLIGEKRQQALSHHVFWKEWELRKGLMSLINSSHQASMDICRHDAILGELARSQKFPEVVDYTVGYATQKDTIAYCAIVGGIRDTLCEILKLRADIASQIEEQKSAVFDTDISEFVRQLRNNLLHGRVVIPQSEISYNVESNFGRGSMMYQVDSLMRSGKWSERSRNFVSGLREEKVQLSTIVRMHFRLLDKSIRKIGDAFARHATPSEKDFFEIEDEHKRRGGRLWAGLMIGQIGRGMNPYDYLHKYFEPEILREILRRPPHSKEQVDFMITLKAAEIDVDDELRSRLYRIFGVTSDSDS